MQRPRDPLGEFDELRRLLLSREREQIRNLSDRISDKERRSQDIASVLPEAVKMSRERGEQLTNALRPAVEGSIVDSIGRRPEIFVEALHPIIGPIVRKSVAETLRRLLQSFNQSLEHTFSWRGLKWRWEALRTGRSFAEVVMLRSLVYRVEQLFLIHRETSLSLLHVTADAALSKDSDMVAGMLSAIQDFARDSFATAEDSALEEFRVGDLQVWIAPGRHAYLAAVIRGNPSLELRPMLQETIETVHVLKGSALAEFQGDASAFEPLRPELESCLRAQHATTKKEGRSTRAWIVIMLIAAMITSGLILAWRNHSRWKDFLDRLRTQPGLVVTEARKGWFGRADVRGLRDASAPDPAAIAREAGLDPKRIRFHWNDYLALDPASVKRRFEQRFAVPEQTRIAIKDGVLEVAGSVPYEWLDRVRREATLIPGVRSVVETGANIIYDPELARRRFEQQFGLLDTVNAVVANGVLTLTGEASHKWLMRARAAATTLPGITSLDDHVVDLDQRAFDQSKSIIESAFVYFLTDKDDIATEGFAALSRLPDEIRRCEKAAKQIGLDVTLEIHGYADAVGTESRNADLRQRRANKVRDFLVSCGFEPARLKPMGIEQPFKPALGDKATPEQAQRRVAFKVMTQPSVPAP
ncbi:MAG TPA: OmpA family protein [Chthoniobacterales bacterium]|nr:OmpA family protein [Chthoniobacterales bacterium]